MKQLLSPTGAEYREPPLPSTFLPPFKKMGGCPGAGLKKCRQRQSPTVGGQPPPPASPFPLKAPWSLSSGQGGVPTTHPHPLWPQALHLSHALFWNNNLLRDFWIRRQSNKSFQKEKFISPQYSRVCPHRKPVRL